MTLFSRERSVKLTRAVSCLLALLLVWSPGASRAASSAASSSVATGTVSVATEPPGARVYLDSRLAGLTPLDIEGVAIGDRRIRVVKAGYLENARIVKVSAGRRDRVEVKLTSVGASSAASNEAQVVTNKQGGGGGLMKNKWFWVAVGGGAAAGTTAYLLTRNSAPVAGPITVTPAGTGMAGVTPFSFSSQSSDPDGDSLAYSWNFGDGVSGTGATPNHVYGTPGSFSVTLSVSDGKKSASPPAVSVTVGQNLSATWTGGRENNFGCSVNWQLSQNGSTLTGTMIFTGGCTGSLAGVTGTVNGLTHPATVAWTSPSYSFNASGVIYSNLVMSFSGTTNSSGSSISGALRLRQTSSAFDQSYPATYNR